MTATPAPNDSSVEVTDLVPDLDISSLDLGGKVEALAKLKGHRLSFKQLSEAVGTERLCPVYFREEDLGADLIAKIIRDYHNDLPLTTIIRRHQQHRMLTGGEPLSIIDIYGVLNAALRDGRTKQRSTAKPETRYELTIEVFTRLFTLWREGQSWYKVKQELLAKAPTENVLKSAWRSITDRYRNLGGDRLPTPTQPAEYPLINLLMFAERQILPDGRLAMAIPVQTLPLPLKRIVEELYCFRGFRDQEFKFEEEVNAELQRMLKPENRINSVEQVAAQRRREVEAATQEAARVPVRDTAFKSEVPEEVSEFKPHKPTSKPTVMRIRSDQIDVRDLNEELPEVKLDKPQGDLPSVDDLLGGLNDDWLDRAPDSGAAPPEMG